MPRVAAFTGHMIDAPGRIPPRFPPGKVEAVRDALAGLLGSLDVAHGVCSAARGSDLLFLEEVLRRGGRASVCLPFPRQEFKRTSVGQGWDAVFDRLLGASGVEEVVELAPAVPPERQQPAAYAACNTRIQRSALAIAERRHEMPVLVCVWDGRPGDGIGGTADAVRSWTAQGHPLEIIDIARL